MDAWDLYSARMNVVGCPKREMWINHTRESIARRMLDSPACHVVLINGVPQTVTITHKPDMDIKRICAIPGESLPHGGLVDFADNKWLITEIDPDKEIYQRGLMQQCNHILRWIGKDGAVREKWCHVVDGTKYLIGEKVHEVMTIGDARIAVTVGKDAETIELARGMRFIIDDVDTENPLVYEITKANRLFNNFNNEGVFRFILTEVNLTINDNVQLRIADYNNWMPDRTTDGDHVDSTAGVAEIVQAATYKAEETPDDNKEVWL